MVLLCTALYLQRARGGGHRDAPAFYAQVYISICMYVYLYIYIYVCVCIYIYVYIIFGVREEEAIAMLRIFYAQVYISICMYVYIYIYVCVCVCVCVYIHILSLGRGRRRQSRCSGSSMPRYI